VSKGILVRGGSQHGNTKRRDSAGALREFSSNKASGYFQQKRRSFSDKKIEVDMSMTQVEEPCSKLIACSRLHPFPSVAMRLMSLIQQEAISLVEIGQVLETDAPLSLTVLRAANSPLFSRGEIKSIPLALIILGVDRVSLLTLTAAVLQTMPGAGRRDYVQAWWRHNLATALFAKHLSRRNMVPEYSYMCGLVHSIGQLLLFESFPARYESLLAEAAAGHGSLTEMERDNFGADHCELGASLLRKWNVPREMEDVAAHYRDPENAQTETTGLVAIACQIADRLGFTVSPGLCEAVEDLYPLTKATLENERLCLEISDRVEAIESSLTR
jgi:HD-like signal output (HDOD) protein